MLGGGSNATENGNGDNATEQMAMNMVQQQMMMAGRLRQAADIIFRYI
jgi:hypothetical protein